MMLPPIQTVRGGLSTISHKSHAPLKLQPRSMLFLYRVDRNNKCSRCIWCRHRRPAQSHFAEDKTIEEIFPGENILRSPNLNRCE
jgi:hypothetical protein